MSTKMNTKSGKRKPKVAEALAVNWLQGEMLHRYWTRAHHTDREPWPDEPLIKRMAGRYEGVASWMQSQPSTASVAHALQQAWRYFHAGEFAKAIDLGTDLGPLGAIVANKAAAVDTLYRKGGQAQILKVLVAAAERGEQAVRALEEHANAHYTLALVLGRYSQRVSIANALAEGLGGRVRKHLERALELEPRHAEAHLALGLYHAEIVAKLGSIVAGLTYGASRGAALEHFQQARKLAPSAPIVLMEHAHGLLLLDPDANRQAARELYAQAADCEPLDAMERLDVARARAGLE